MQGNSWQWKTVVSHTWIKMILMTFVSPHDDVAYLVDMVEMGMMSNQTGLAKSLQGAAKHCSSVNPFFACWQNWGC